MYGKIANAKIAKEAWDILKLSYKGVDKAQKSKLKYIWREYEKYEMSSSESVEQYFSCVVDLVNKIRIYGEEIPKSKVVEKNSLYYANQIWSCGDYNNKVTWHRWNNSCRVIRKFWKSYE